MSWSWACNCGTLNSDSYTCACGRTYDRRPIHKTKAIVYLNPRTGERRIPATADQAMPAAYERQGYERVEIESMSKFERETGLVHEASNYSSGSGLAERDLQPATTPVEHDPALTHRLAEALRE